MDRMGLLVLRTRAMGDASSKSGSLSPSANALSAASSKRELLLSRLLHVNRLHIYN
jgi:hypothetical protein